MLTNYIDTLTNIFSGSSYKHRKSQRESSIPSRRQGTIREDVCWKNERYKYHTEN